MSAGALLLPLGAGFGYACGALVIKRALVGGASAKAVNFVCNAVMALLFQGLWFFPGTSVGGAALGIPLCCGLLFFLGQICTFRAIATGDVSVATPLLGTKVVFVAVFSVLILGTRLPGSWWWAVLMASLGIALVSYVPGGSHRRMLQAVLWSLMAAMLFALTDAFVQAGVPSIGYGRFAPLMFGTTGLLSLCYVPGLLESRRKEGGFHESSPWLLGGAVLMGLQSLGMYSAIGLYGDATFTNILYGSRCIWSVLLVWILLLGAGTSTATEGRGSLMARRLTGALLLFAAMTLVLSRS